MFCEGYFFSRNLRTWAEMASKNTNALYKELRLAKNEGDYLDSNIRGRGEARNKFGSGCCWPKEGSIYGGAVSESVDNGNSDGTLFSWSCDDVGYPL